MDLEELSSKLAKWTKNDLDCFNDCLYTMPDCDSLYGCHLKIKDNRTEVPPDTPIPEDSFCRPMNKENAALLLTLTAAWLFWTVEDVKHFAECLKPYQLELMRLETIHTWHSV